MNVVGAKIFKWAYTLNKKYIKYISKILLVRKNLRYVIYHVPCGEYLRDLLRCFLVLHQPSTMICWCYTILQWWFVGVTPTLNKTCWCYTTHRWWFVGDTPTSNSGILVPHQCSKVVSGVTPGIPNFRNLVTHQILESIPYKEDRQWVQS